MDLSHAQFDRICDQFEADLLDGETHDLDKLLRAADSQDSKSLLRELLAIHVEVRGAAATIKWSEQFAAINAENRERVENAIDALKSEEKWQQRTVPDQT